jgi:hypothetical protein
MSAQSEIERAGIVGGVETNYESWQSVVMVQSLFNLCSGTLIHPRVVLTAGHCVLRKDVGENGEEVELYDFSKEPSRIAVYGGSTGQQLLSRVEAVAMHPDWDGIAATDAADLALLVLRDDISDLVPYKLRDFPTPEEGETGIIVGYGNNEENESGVHRMGETTLLHIDFYFIEIGGESNTCNGDSGGPLFTEQNGEWVVTGVHSFGAEECYVDSGGYSVNLLSYCDWLNDAMVELVGTDLGLDNCTSCEARPVADWGEPCGPGYPCCKTGTLCRKPEDFSRDGLGYCAPACCAVGTGDPMYCNDVSDGDEQCSFTSDLGSAYCAIHCEDDADCKEGTVCRNRPFASDKICIADQRGEGEVVECDTSDQHWDTDVEDTDPDAGGGEADGDNGSSNEGCGCSLIGKANQHRWIDMLPMLAEGALTVYRQ